MNEVAGDDVESQTRQALTNIAGILEDAGTNLENVLKTTVFLRDMNDFTAMNKHCFSHDVIKKSYNRRKIYLENGVSVIIKVKRYTL